jgi:hypothetical protein
MNLSALILLLRSKPQDIEFNQVIDVITQHYVYHPTRFSNGELVNAPGTNEGSCKIFYFAHIHKLSAAETLQLFGDYYRKDVLEHANRSDHSNIRNFVATGWQGIIFAGQALVERD